MVFQRYIFFCSEPDTPIILLNILVKNSCIIRVIVLMDGLDDNIVNRLGDVGIILNFSPT